MNIKCTQNIYKSANGVSNVTYYILSPQDVEVRGIVQLSHSMCEYFSRYTTFAKYLCELGFIVCGNDHIGHGASVSRDSELGFFAKRDGWKYLVEDVKQLTDLMQRRYPTLPYFLIGHSMGSLVARLYMTEYGDRLSGCILISTVGPSPAAVGGARLADSIARSRGMTYRSSFLSNLSFRGFNRKIKHPRSVFDWLCRDEDIVSLYQSDAKCNFVFTATGFRDLYTLCAKANSNQTFRRTPHALPLLFLAGDKDPIGKYGDGVRRVVNLYRGAGVKNIEVIFYKDARHEVLNELGHLEAFGDISRWLEAQLTAHAADADEQTVASEQITVH
ncbi:MAG: alpha/beta hydrolase [Agathobaculum sp.]|uniref:alpha/beta fold hydrolase n=1 Tax=Agathobaculum sp. TaxID=2048138 RepID=UPI0025BBE923|nr:alpha/beta hydrolase [Agathobaculum sp.]MCI7124636.1 alpha/beta hydrolase [Agathobaculum sp.]